MTAAPPSPSTAKGGGRRGGGGGSRSHLCLRFAEEKPKELQPWAQGHAMSNSRTEPSSQALAAPRGLAAAPAALPPQLPAPPGAGLSPHTDRADGREAGTQPAPRAVAVRPAPGVKGLPWAETDAAAQACAWSAAHTGRGAVRESGSEAGAGREGPGPPAVGRWGRPAWAQAAGGACPAENAEVPVTPAEGGCVSTIKLPPTALHNTAIHPSSLESIFCWSKL